MKLGSSDNQNTTAPQNVNNAKNVKISDLLAFLVIMLFSSLFSYPKIICGEDVHF